MRLVAMLSCLLLALAGLSAADSVRVLTDRTESHLAPLLEHFQETSGITVEAVYVDKGLLPRLQAQPTEADLVITKTAENLEYARRESLLQPWSSKAIATLPPQFQDPDRAYVITSYRARGLYLSRERVPAGAIATYRDLIKPEWKGRIAIRSGYHDYNVSLFCQMAASEGIEATRTFIAGLKANLARTPTSNDRGQVRAIHDGIADVSIGNSYYQGIMMGRDDQRPWAEAARVFFPDQAGQGTYVMQAAAGLTTATRNVDGATRLLEYLVSDFAQYYMASALHVYPVRPHLPLSDFTRTLGADQPEVVDGRFKARFVPLREVDQYREQVIAILNAVDFDR